MAEPPRPPRPSPAPPRPPRPSPSGTPGEAPRSTTSPSERPSIALALGRAPVEPDVDLNAAQVRGGFATMPLRPLIDIAQPRLTLVVESEGGNVVGRTVVHEGDVCRIGTHPSNDLTL